MRTFPGPVRNPLHPEHLARFVEPLPIPAIRKPDGVRPSPEDPRLSVAYHRISMKQAELQVHRDLPPTKFWTYDGTLPGPTLEARSGRGLLVEWVNELPTKHFLPIDYTLCGAGHDRPDVRTVVHVHGGRVPPESDGHPERWYVPGKSATSFYPNHQDPATLWYHDHAMGIARLNHYAGLFGFYLIRDEVEDALTLPKDEFEIPVVLCDRLFDADGSLHYPTSGNPDTPWVPEVYGDTFLVNGKLLPYLEVAPTKYRFRLLNASNSRFFYLSLSDRRSFHQVGSDQGLLSGPAELRSFTLSPAERADLVVDFAGAEGTKVVLSSQSFELMQFRVTSARTKQVALPASLRKVVPLQHSAAVKTRRLTLNEYQDPKTHQMLMLLDAKRFRDQPTEKPVLGSTEIWELVNSTEDTHPIHLHLVRFQILDRQPFDADEYLRTGSVRLLEAALPPEPNEAGWKDTVRADPGTITRIIVRFDGYAGTYVWHCHLLEHAANEMMRPLEVVTG